MSTKLSIYTQLKLEVLKCSNCDLYCLELEGHDPHVIGEGNLDAKVMFIAEAPGLNETIYHRPLIPPGVSGIKYEEVLAELGLKREEVYTCNSIICRPPKNRDPETWELLRCSGFLKRQIELVSPKLIVSLGRFAGQSLVRNFKMTADRGKIIHSDKFGIDVFPLYHPCFVKAYASMERRREFDGDIVVLKEIIKKME